MTFHRLIPIALAAATLLGVASSTHAAPSSAESDALAVCMADNTTGKDRKDLARWVFSGMAAHPEIKRLGNVSAQDRAEIDKTIAALMMRLLTQSCPEQTRVVSRAGGNGAEMAFAKLGELAMQELVTDPGVTATMSAFVQHADLAKLGEVLMPAAKPK